jgi:hypothetical protein
VADADLDGQQRRHTPNLASVLRVKCSECGNGIGGEYNSDVILPLVRPSRQFDGLPGDVAKAWDEARSAYSVGAYTAAEIMCRKILMHLAVDKAGAQAGQSFVSYIDALEAAHYVSSSLEPAVDAVRRRGNIANHELPASAKQEAIQTIAITAHLLVVVAAGPFIVRQPASGNGPAH